METFVQSKTKQGHNISKTAAIQEKQTVAEQSEPLVKVEEMKSAPKSTEKKGVLPAVITTLLLVPLLLVVIVGVFMCWRKNSTYDVKLETLELQLFETI